MINILIDSNIYISLNYNIFSGPLKSLELYSKKGIVKLYTNDIINREVLKHLNQDLSCKISSIKKAINSPIMQVAQRCSKSSLLYELESLQKDLENSLLSYFINAAIIKNDSVSLGTILQQYFEVVPPFENNGAKIPEMDFHRLSVFIPG